MARIAGWEYADFDWGEFLRLAEHHGVLALAGRNLIDHAPDLPPEIRSALEAAYAANFRRNLWFAAELMRITRHLAQKGLRAIPYKGPMLAQSAYGNLTLRSFSDLDLLIAPHDFAKAKPALAEIGYQPSAALTPAIERLCLRAGYERSFDGPGGKNLLELQWALLPRFYAIDPQHFCFDDLWARTRLVDLGKETSPENRVPQAEEKLKTGGDCAGLIPCLSPEDSLLILCLHAAKHLWTRLIWIADIVESLNVPNLDLGLVVSRARSIGVMRTLGVSFWLAEHLLGTILPREARDVIEPDSEIPSLGKGCTARLRLCAGYDFESIAYFRQILRLRERSRDRWQYLWRLLSTPSQGDIDAVALPEMLFPLYRGVRGARLLARLVKSRPQK